MKLGVFIRTMGPQATRDILATCVQAIEETGFDAALIGDHLAIPLRPFVFAPRPVRPPIWIGGAGPRALERTLQFGEGYYPMGLSRDDLQHVQTYFAEEDAKRKRAVPELITGDFVGTFPEGEAGQLVDQIAAYKEVGASYFNLSLGRYPDVATFRRRLEWFASEVRPQL